MSYPYEDPTGLKKWGDWSTDLLKWCTKQGVSAWKRNETLSNPTGATHEKQWGKRFLNWVWNAGTALPRLAVASLRTVAAVAAGSIGLLGLGLGACLWEGLAKGLGYTLGGLAKLNLKLFAEGIVRLTGGAVALPMLGFGAAYYGLPLVGLTTGVAIAAGVSENLKEHLEHRYKPGSPPEKSVPSPEKPASSTGNKFSSAQQMKQTPKPSTAPVNAPSTMVHQLASMESSVQQLRASPQQEHSTGTRNTLLHDRQRTAVQDSINLETPQQHQVQLQGTQTNKQEMQNFLKNQYGTTVTASGLVGSNPIDAIPYLKQGGAIKEEQTFTLKIKMKAGEPLEAAVKRVNALLSQKQATNPESIKHISHVEIVNPEAVGRKLSESGKVPKIPVKDGQVEITTQAPEPSPARDSRTPRP